jgi:hypothetical protein
MKFNIFFKIPKVGDTKTESFFALFPVTITKWKPFIATETRWLEKVTIKYKFTKTSSLEEYNEYWEKVEFIDNEKK